MSFLLHSRWTFQRNFFVGDIYSINWIKLVYSSSSQHQKFCIQISILSIGKEVRRRNQRQATTAKRWNIAQTFVNIAILEKNKLPQSDVKLWARKSVGSKYFSQKMEKEQLFSDMNTIIYVQVKNIKNNYNRKFHLEYFK